MCGEGALRVRVGVSAWGGRSEWSVQVVDEIYDQEAAAKMGIDRVGQVARTTPPKLDVGWR